MELIKWLPKSLDLKLESVLLATESIFLSLCEDITCLLNIFLNFR